MGNSLTPVHEIKNVERICAPYINNRILRNIEIDLEPLEKEDRNCMRYCYQLINDTDEKVFENALLSIVGNKVNVTIKAGDCENKINVSLNHKNEPWHYPDLPKRSTKNNTGKKDKQEEKSEREGGEADERSKPGDKPNENQDQAKNSEFGKGSAQSQNEEAGKDVVNYITGENKYELRSKEITLESITKIQARLKSHGFNPTMQQCLLYTNRVIQEEKSVMDTAEIKIHCDGKIVLIRSYDEPTVRISIGVDGDRNPFKIRDPPEENDNQGRTSKRKGGKASEPSKPGDKQQDTKGPKENRKDNEGGKQSQANSDVKGDAKSDTGQDPKFDEGHQPVNNVTPSKHGSAYSGNSNGYSEQKIGNESNNDKQNMKTRSRKMSQNNEDSGEKLMSKIWPCGRIDTFYNILTVEDVDNLIEQEESLDETQSACLQHCRDLIEGRIKKKHNLPLVNFQVIVLPESKCSGKHWRLVAGAGTNSYTITWNKERRKAYCKNTSKTTKQAALETAQLLLPNYLGIRSIKCSNCNAIIKAVCDSWFESDFKQSGGRVLCKNCKVKAKIICSSLE